MYDSRSPELFKAYGGDQWPSIVLPKAFNDTPIFGGFGYGKVIVDEAGIVRSIHDFRFEEALDNLFLFEPTSAKTKEESKARNETWYQGNSWRFYEDEGIDVDEIDRAVAEELDASNDSRITINGDEFEIDSISMDDHRRGQLLTAKFNSGDEMRILFWQGNSWKEDSGDVAARAKCYRKDDSDSKKAKLEEIGIGDVMVTYSDNGFAMMSGTLSKKDDEAAEHKVELKIHESIFGIGDSQLTIDGDQALLSGTLGSMTYQQIEKLIAERPEVKTITLTDVAGSVNDAVNMHTGRIIREAGLNTRVPADGNIASGGVDLFCAGVKRTVAKGAKLGIHSWSDGRFDGADYPTNHPVHQYQLAYFEMMLGPEQGPEFYFHTLNAAPADDIHIMGQAEIKRWKVGNN